MLIGLAGALGALSRYKLQGWIVDYVGRPTVLATGVINISGAFILGLFIALVDDRALLPASWRPVVAVGFLGAYTTFSTLMFESVDKLETGDMLTATANIGGSVVLGLIACYAGLTLGRAL